LTVQVSIKVDLGINIYHKANIDISKNAEIREPIVKFIIMQSQ